MIFRETTQEDLDYCSKYGISGGKFDLPGDTVTETVTLELEGLVIAIGGIVKITETTAWSWVEVTPESIDHIYTFYRTVKEWSDICAKLNGIRRYQSWVDASNEKHIRFAKHLGFEVESTMKDFLGKGKDALLFVKMMDE